MRRLHRELLKSVRNRSSRSDLLTADRYFRDIEGCFAGGACPTQLFDKARPGDWERSLKEAETRLVWRDRNSKIEQLERESADSDASALLEFDAVIPPPRQEFAGINPKEWLYWIKAAVQAGKAKLLKGKIPAEVDYKPRRFGEMKSTTDKLVEAMIAVTHASLSDKDRKEVAALLAR